MIKLPLTLCLGLVTKETHDVIGVHSMHYLRASVPFVSRMNMINKFSLFHSGGFNAAVCDFPMLGSQLDSFFSCLLSNFKVISTGIYSLCHTQLIFYPEKVARKLSVDHVIMLRVAKKLNIHFWVDCVFLCKQHCGYRQKRSAPFVGQL